MKKIIIVDRDSENTRLDRWFKRNINDVPQSLIEKNIRKGKIKINNKKEKSSYKLKMNDHVVLYDLNFIYKIGKKKLSVYKATKKELTSTSEIFIENNENFVVINKPSGIAVQRGTKSRRNIIDILRSTAEFRKSTPFVVHRIDKDTTGILIVAKNRKYAQLFTTLFRLRKIYKTYLGIVLGQMEKKQGTFTDFLYYYEGVRKITTKAITKYKVLDSNIRYSLVKLYPTTGRKHQLRKQLLLHGHPILGDSKYRISENYLNNKNILMLHAYKIKFLIDNVKYNFLAELPTSFKNTLKEKSLKISQ